MNWLYYLAEANIYLGVFYLAYCLFLNRETYYQLNRAYLIFSCVVSFVLPVMQIGALKPAEAVETTVQTYTIPVQTTQAAAPIAAPVVIEHHLTLPDYLWYAYLVGAIVLLLVLLIKLYTLFKLMRSAQFIERGRHKVVYLAETDVAFSFLNYLFIGTNAPGANTMIRHELVHIRQRHSADIIFIEVLKIISWFNPCIYLLQNSLKTVHEYIADEQTAAYETDALTYSSFLVNNAYGAGGSSITHSFFNYNLLKKRIIMLNQQRSGNLARLKYLVAVPICAGLLCASTLAFSKTYGWVDLAPKHVVQNPKVLPPPPPVPPKPQQSNMPPPPRPSVFKNGYMNFAQYLYSHASYPEGANQKNISGLVILSYNLDDKGLINDVKVVQKGGNGFDEAAMKALQGYKKTIKDGAGAHTLSILFDILGPGTHLTASHEIRKQPGFAGDFVVSNRRFPPPIVRPDRKVVKFPPPIVVPDAPQGYAELRNYLSKLGYAERITKNALNGSVLVGYTINDDHKISNVKLVRSAGNGFDEHAINALNAYTGTIGDKSGEHTLNIIFSTPRYFTPLVKTDKNTPGYSGELFIWVPLPPPPKPRITQLRFPPPVVKPDTITKKVSDAFYRYIRNNIRYPAEARSNNITGRVIVTFSVADNKITDIKILRGLEHGLNEELTRVLQKYTPNGNVPPGKYAMSVGFILADAGETPNSPDNVLVFKKFNKGYKGVNGFIGLDEVVVASYKER